MWKTVKTEIINSRIGTLHLRRLDEEGNPLTEYLALPVVIDYDRSWDETPEGFSDEEVKDLLVDLIETLTPFHPTEDELTDMAYCEAFQ